VAGTTVTENVGNGTTTAFTFNGRTTDEGHAYLVSVGGIDQPPSKYTISNANNGTITFVDPPVNNELISIRAIVSSGGGGGSGDATSLQGVAISSATPDSGQGLVYDGTEWAPAGIGNATSIKDYPITASYTPANGDFINFNNGEWTGSGINTGNATSLQNTPISSSAPAEGNLLRFDGTNWAPFNGLAVPAWDSTIDYMAGDVVTRNSVVFICIQSMALNQDPAGAGGQFYWATMPGVYTGSTVPSDAVNVAGWVKVKVQGLPGTGLAFMPFYQ
jgi:hypothetical protein